MQQRYGGNLTDAHGCVATAVTLNHGINVRYNDVSVKSGRTY